MLDPLQLADRLVASAPDLDTRTLAIMIRMRVSLPMTKVLDKVPGDDIRQKAKKLRVSRQSLYDWRDGKQRPRLRQAVKIAKVTGFKVHEIAGVPEKEE